MVKKILSLIILLVVCFTVSGKPAKINTEIPTIVFADSTSILLDFIDVEPSVLYIPIVFEKQQILNDTIPIPKYVYRDSSYIASVDYTPWLTEALKKSRFENYHINRVVYQTPEIVKYNWSMLPDLQSIML